MKGQPGFFDLAERHDKLTQMRDPLVVLKKEIDWEAFRADLAKIHEITRPSLRPALVHALSGIADGRQGAGRKDGLVIS